ncbi:RNA polymerase sigma factor [Ferruginibacter sp. SUN106]|uniref:RNA polymerase sigma factor n=1 Tax=Ferruginibacter sp. SUN106 TaxID=2978348 RepID=UPI003D36B4BF
MDKKDDFVQLIKANEGIIYKITAVYSNNAEDQKDLYQEIVYQLWKAQDSYRGDAKISTWIYRIALNTSIAHINKEKKLGNKVPIGFELLNTAGEADKETEERLTILYAAIKKLSVVEKGIVLLFLDGNSHEEIAAITGFTKTNIGTRLGRIKEKLRSQIKQ